MEERTGIASVLIAAIDFMQRSEIEGLEDATKRLETFRLSQTHNHTHKQTRERLSSSESVKQVIQKN